MNLTAEEIRAMPAGREMDALVAVELMGWTRIGEGLSLFFVPPPDDERRGWAAEWDKNGVPDWMPEWSADLAAAWRVVEKITEPGNAASLTFTIAMDAVGDDLWCSTAQEAAFLICSVALIVTDLVATEED